MHRRDIGRDPGLSARMFLVMFLLALVYLFFVSVLWALGVNWIVIAVFAAIMLGIQYYFSDKLVLMSMGAKVVSPQEAPDLHAVVERLAIQAGIPKPRVAIAETHIPNAFATGRNPKASVVCVTTGIMSRLSKEELEAVLAHELTHVKNRDVAVITIASFFATVASMMMNMFMWMGLFGGFGGGTSERRNNSAGAFILAYLVTVLVWLLSFLLIRALSRYREYAADLGGAVLTGAPSRLASALMKISGAMARIPQQDLRRAQTANAFFIIPALSGNALAELFSTHPPVEKRVERLRRLARDLEGR
ncbi:MAG: zinc metalloprotease HtpX [Chloroflexi bacterium]|nr:zinc metalloprotease HtpX [Chloroflexota bacterium]